MPRPRKNPRLHPESLQIADTIETRRLMDLDIAFQNINIDEADFAKGLTPVALTAEEKEFRTVYKALKATPASDTAAFSDRNKRLDELLSAVNNAHAFRGRNRRPYPANAKCELCYDIGSFLERGEIIWCPVCNPKMHEKQNKQNKQRAESEKKSPGPVLCAIPPRPDKVIPIILKHEATPAIVLDKKCPPLEGGLPVVDPLDEMFS